MRRIFGHDPEETCMIAGSTMDDLYFAEDSKEARRIKRAIHFAILRAVEDGYCRFVVMPAYGVGLWAAESVLAIRRMIPFVELETVEGEETESEGELSEPEFDSLMERKEWIGHWAKGAYILADCGGDPNREIFDAIRPGLLLVFDGGQDESFAELEEAAKARGGRAEGYKI